MFVILYSRSPLPSPPKDRGALQLFPFFFSLSPIREYEKSRHLFAHFFVSFRCRFVSLWLCFSQRNPTGYSVVKEKMLTFAVLYRPNF